MVINGLRLPSIGFIRAKPLATGGGFLLTIYPPGCGPLAGITPATALELVVSDAEALRIAKVAPHLMSLSMARLLREINSREVC